MFSTTNLAILGLASAGLACGYYCTNSVKAEVQKRKPIVCFVLGGPGAGKSTQCQRIVNKFGYFHISAGELLRIEMADPTSQYGIMIKEIIQNGTIVPAYVTIKLLRKTMESSGGRKFLIDGFPRNFENNEAWVKEMTDVVEVPYLIFFDCPEEVMIERLLSRQSGRTDDNVQSIKKRFKTFNEQTRAVIAYYEKQNKVIKVDANKSLEEVTADLDKVFSRLEREFGE